MPLSFSATEQGQWCGQEEEGEVKSGYHLAKPLPAEPALTQTLSHFFWPLHLTQTKEELICVLG